MGSTDSECASFSSLVLSLGACGFWGFDLDGGGTVSVVLGCGGVEVGGGGVVGVKCVELGVGWC